ncbi:MAG: DUF131 domain-containing protein [Candidatus Thorarchaeota archaeon]
MSTQLALLGMLLIFFGIMLIMIAQLSKLWPTHDDETQQRIESRGIILIGPIPIVWGFGRRGKLISILLFVAVLAITLILILA